MKNKAQNMAVVSVATARRIDGNPSLYNRRVGRREDAPRGTAARQPSASPLHPLP
jgi:hypothetical protein